MMKGLRLAVLIAGLTASPCFAAAVDDSPGAVAEEENPSMKLGLLELHPYDRLSEAFDSNIYLVPRGAGVRSSWITANELGLDFKRPLNRKQAFSGGYEFGAQHYTTQPGVNDNFRQRASLRYDYAGPFGMNGNVSEAYINTTDPASSELTQRQKRWNNLVTGKFEYAPTEGRLSAGLDASQSVDKYLNSALAELLNRNEIRAGLSAALRVQPQTKMFAAYHRGVIHYSVHDFGDPDKDSKAHYADIGLQGRLLPKTTGTLQAGYTYRQYDVAPAGAPSRLIREWTLDGRIGYVPFERTAVNLVARRALQESIFGANLYYIENFFSLELEHRLSRRLIARGLLAMGIDRYPLAQTLAGVTAVRRDDIYQQGGSVQYDIRDWSSMILGYLHRKRNSIFSGQFDYEDHLATLSLSARL